MVCYSFPRISMTSDQPKFRPLERFWPYAELSEQPTDAELATLDPAARSLILKMPPRVREELLQGMREEGPEGYRKFIEDYFKRLTEVKSPK